MIKWSIKRDGAAVEHRATYRGFDLLVTNFPGWRTLTWEIAIGEFKNGREECRFEGGVNRCKERAIARVDEIKLRWEKENLTTATT